jgi:hypothetical protein
MIHTEGFDAETGTSLVIVLTKKNCCYLISNEVLCLTHRQILV